MNCRGSWLRHPEKKGGKTMPDTQKKLNAAQEEAVRTIRGPVCVIAVPGSGKTTTLVSRVRYMIQEGVNPFGILVMTFSKAAATDMEKRYETLYGKNPGVAFCTIHAYCFRVLRDYCNLTFDSILQEGEKRAFFFQILKKMKESRSIMNLAEFTEALCLDISVLKNSPSRQRNFQPSCCQDRTLFERLARTYEEYKQNAHKIDFDDMLVLTARLFQEHPEILAAEQDRFHYFLIDEHQDTNEIQKNILYSLAEKERNLFAVGDDDQSIYAFRGAEPSIILSFQKDFPEAKMIFMDTNYRSGDEILDHSQKLIRHNSKRYKKNIRGGRHTKGSAESLRFRTRKEELDYIAQEAEAEFKKRNTLSDHAVLYRTKAQGEALASRLLLKGIPFTCRDGASDRYSSWVFKDIVSYYRIANGTGTKADLAGILNHPNRYLPTSLAYQAPLAVNAYLDYTKQIPVQWKREAAEDKVIDFFSMLYKMRNQTPAELIRILDTSAGYRKFLTKQAEFLNQDPEDLLSMFDAYIEDAEKYGDDWDRFLSFARQYSDMMQQKSKNPEGITLSTMHSAKGLEWKTVYVIDCIEGKTPFAKAEGDPAQEEEERRLFYVAMTRAKDRLVLCGYQKNLKNKDAYESIYLREAGLSSKRAGYRPKTV